MKKVLLVYIMCAEVTVSFVCGDQYEHGDDQSLAAVVKMMPNKVKRRRKIQTESGVSKQLCAFEFYCLLNLIVIAIYGYQYCY